MIEDKTCPRGWQASPDLLQGRIVLVTGAGNGIGRAMVNGFARHGATNILLDRDVRALEQVYDEITAAGLPEPAIYPLDLKGATPEDYAALAGSIEGEFGHLDALVHNAAMLGALTPIANFDDDLWFETLQVNLNAPYLLTKHCFGLLKESEDASIVFSSDSVGRQGKAYWGAYAVTKAGLESLMQTLADETEANTSIRVNSLDPGPVRTALRVLAYPAENRDALKLPDQVITPYLYLVGPDSRSITGRQFSAGDFE